jgi:hypothetical protein
MNIHIDRIILKDMDVDPDRASGLRFSLRSELERIIASEGLPDGIVEGKVSRISAPAINASESGGERALAGSLARSIHRGLGGLGR